MVYVSLRVNVADYEKWRPFFDGVEDFRRSKGGTGMNQVFRDADAPNTVTLIMEWDNAENARSYLSSPELRAAMQKAGVTGAPALASVLLKS